MSRWFKPSVRPAGTAEVIDSLDISLPRQGYIEVIHDLCVEHGHAHMKLIAERLSVSMPSANEAVRGLADDGLVNYTPRRGVTMTELGRQVASELAYRHKTLGEFFSQVLGIPAKRADKLACRLEHFIDLPLRNRLNDFIHFMTEELPAGGHDPIAEFQKRHPCGRRGDK